MYICIYIYVCVCVCVYVYIHNESNLWRWFEIPLTDNAWNLLRWYSV